MKVKVKVVALFFAVVLTTAAAALAPTCGEYGCGSPSGPYYTILLDEPDWCSYEVDDWVSIRWDTVSNEFTQVSWYVIPRTDTTSLPPPSFPQTPWLYVNKSGDYCFPWFTP